MAAAPRLLPFLIVLPLLLLADRGSSVRLISGDPSGDTELVSDGAPRRRESDWSSPFLLLRRGGRMLPRLQATAESCEQTYGFLPCTTTVVGNLFLVLAYGFLMFKAATFLSSGSELLLEILGPGIVGGLFLPVLGALPDALLILGFMQCLELG